MSPAPTIAELRQARDTAQTTYAHARQRAVLGRVGKAELDRKRAAYLLAQGALRDALIQEKKRQ